MGKVRGKDNTIMMQRQNNLSRSIILSDEEEIKKKSEIEQKEKNKVCLSVRKLVATQGRKR